MNPHALNSQTSDAPSLNQKLNPRTLPAQEEKARRALRNFREAVRDSLACTHGGRAHTHTLRQD